MSKYDIHKNKELPSDEEINKYKNFDQVVKKAAMLDYKQATKPIYKNTKVLSAVAVIVAVGLIILFETTEQNDGRKKVPEHKTDTIKSTLPVEKTDSVQPVKPTSATSYTEAVTLNQPSVSTVTEQQAHTAEQTLTADAHAIHTNENALAAFPGGEDALKSFLLKNIKYPYNAVESPYSGKVEVDLVIEKSGNIGNITIYHSPNAAISNEIKRVIGKMPAWNACVKHGQPVASTVSVDFPFTYPGE